MTNTTAEIPDDGYGGHDFCYESSSDLFRCSLCREYEVVARSIEGPATQSGRRPIAPCTGLVGYKGDTERVYLRLFDHPDADQYVAWLAGRIRESGIGRAPRFSYRPGQWIVESAPSVVDELVRHVERITFYGRSERAFHTIERLTGDEGRQALAENYAVYVAKYGVPR